MAKTLTDTAKEFLATFNSPLFRDKKYAKALRPLFGTFVLLTERPMPLSVRLSVLVSGVIPESYLAKLENEHEEAE